MTDDPVARLTAGLDADEAAAKAALVEWNAEWVRYEREDLPDAVFTHIARQAPDRTLREVAAKRAILARHSPVKPGTEVACAWCSDDLGAADFHMAWPCPDVLALAAVYSDGAT